MSEFHQEQFPDTPPQHEIDAEFAEMIQADPELRIIGERLGNIALTYEVDVEEAYSSAVEEDITRSYDQALQDNEVFDAYDEAIQEDIDRVYDQALQENEEFDANRAAEEMKPDEDEKKPVKQQFVDDILLKRDESVFEAQQMEEQTTAQQVDQILKEQGFMGGLLPGSAIAKDYANNALVVTNPMGHMVEIITMMPGGGRQVTSYNFDDKAGILRIKSNGSETMMMHSGSYGNVDGQPDEEKASGLVELPPSVAKMTGFKHASLV